MRTPVTVLVSMPRRDPPESLSWNGGFGGKKDPVTLCKVHVPSFRNDVLDLA